ncbi:MAG: hypothetical protein ACKOBN_05195 [Flavobacteriales bacterium]
MRHYFILPLFCVLSFLSLAQRKVQLVILFDTSNSMDGLINQAKARIWNIVNEASTFTYQGAPVILEIAMYDYGNSSLSPSSNYIRKQLDFSTDLDLVSEKLFGLRTSGGDEYCGAVLVESLTNLKWSSDPKDLKLIYIAGNESYKQGPVSIQSACRLATDKNVFISSIFCGDRMQGINLGWKNGADCGNGDYFNINSNEQVQQIETPFDDQIIEQNRLLNDTYIGYGAVAIESKSKQISQDQNALGVSKTVETERYLVKSKSSYKNEKWDIVDANKADSSKLVNMKDEDLPAEMKGMDLEQRKAFVQQKTQEREAIQKEMARLELERRKYIEQKTISDNQQKPDDFGTAVATSMRSKAKALGFE